MPNRSCKFQVNVPESYYQTFVVTCAESLCKFFSQKNVLKIIKTERQNFRMRILYWTKYYEPLSVINNFQLAI